VAWQINPPIPTPAPTCDVATLSCTISELAPGGVVELELDVAVDPALVIDPDVGVVNTADVASSTEDPSLGTNRSVFTVSGAPQADLSIRKLAPGPDRSIFPVDRPVAGLNTSYILEIINFGPSVAPTPVFVDVLPPGMSFVRVFDPTVPDFDLPPDLCVGDGLDPETVTCQLPFDFPASVGTNLGVEVAIDPTLPDGTVLSNRATISSTATDNNQGNNVSSADVAIRAEVNLRLRKLMIEFDASGNPVREVPYNVPPAMPDPLQMPAGYAVGFILDVVNDGPSAASGVTVYDAFEPASAAFQTVDCDLLNGEVVCPYVNDATGNLLLPGEAFQPQLLFLPEGDTAPGEYFNRGRVSSVTAETDLDDNADQRTVEIVEPIADVIVEKAALTSPLVAGDTFTYQVAVSAGRIDFAEALIRLSSDAENVVVTDIVPDGLVPDAATTSQGTCVVSGQEVVCDLGTIGSTVDPARPAPPVLVTITGRVAPSFTATAVTNTAVVTTSTELLGGGADVRAAVTTPVERRAELTMTKVALTPTTPAGSISQFEVTVTNSGPSDALDVVVTDALPAPLEFVAAGSDTRCELETGDVVCRVGAIAVGTTITLAIVASSPPDAAVGTLTNTVVVSSATPDPDPTDNTAEATVTVTREADLSVTKSSDSAAVLLGGTVAYVVAVTNNGPSLASAVVVTEDVPSGTSIVGPLPAGCTGDGPVTCALGNLAAGETATLEIVLAIPEAVPLGSLTNTASVTSETDDPEADNDTAGATIEVIALADVVLDKTLVTSPAIAGQPLVYELTLTNRGPTVAPNPSVTDPIPTGTSYVSLTAPGGQCQLDDDGEGVPAGSCSFAPLAVGSSVTATLTVDTDANLASVLNAAFAGSGGLDQTPADNEDSVDTELQRVADLSVSKVGPATVAAGSTATYTISYRNDGPAAAADVDVIDTLPTGLVASEVPGCSVIGQVVTCPIGTLAAGATGSISVSASVDPNLIGGSSLVNRASIRTADAVVIDPSESNDVSATAAFVLSAPTIDPVPPAPDGGDPVGPGQPGGTLPSTGSPIADVILLALSLLALGGLARVLARAPRRPPSAVHAEVWR
jgi:uncharacterized repeat protein (TIGR01451 family)